MNYFALLKGRTRALITDISSLAVIIIAIAVSIYISQYNPGEKDRSIKIEVVNNDEGKLGNRLTEILSNEEGFEFSVTTYDTAIKNLAADKAQGIVEIAPDFTDKISKGEYESLVSVTVMADSFEMKTFTEMVINDAIKVWSEELVKRRISEVEGSSQDDLDEFIAKTKDKWNTPGMLDIISVMSGEEETQREEEFLGIRWYAFFAMFYLCISGTWMCGYSSGGLLRRVSGKGGKISLLFVFQSLPGIVVSLLGFVPVLIISNHPNPLRVFISFMIYIWSAAAFALIVCCISGRFSNLVLISPLASLAVSLFAGLLCELPDWASVWDITSVIVPGHWFYNAIFDKRFFAGSILVLVAWFLIAMFMTWIFSKRKRSE